MKVSAWLAAMSVGQHLPGRHLEGGRQAGRAVADILELLADGASPRRRGGRHPASSWPGCSSLRRRSRPRRSPAGKGARRVLHAVPEFKGVPAVEPTGDLVRLNVEVVDDAPEMRAPDPDVLGQGAGQLLIGHAATGRSGSLAVVNGAAIFIQPSWP